MYDLPQTRWATERVWAAITSRLRQAGLPFSGPLERLERPEHLAAHWSDPNLLLSQTCGYPLLQLPHSVRVVATPCYGAEGCAGAEYRSALVVRVGDPARSLAQFRGRICAVNGPDSNSGMNLLRAAVAPLAVAGRFFGRVTITGGHLQSLACISSGDADIGAIDCVTWALARRYQPEVVEGLRVLGWTRATPGLPLISAADTTTVAALRIALADIARDPDLQPVLAALFITGFETVSRRNYEIIARLERDAKAAGYPALA